MAHHYSSAPPYGLQYPSAALYSPFTPSPGQAMNNGTPGPQQPNPHNTNSQTPTTPANLVRYDANTHIQMQPAPLPFPPHFNPDFLKHLPPPPPPFPPGVQYANASGPGMGFAPFPQSVGTPPYQSQQQPYLPFPQHTKSMHGESLPVSALVPTQDQRPYNHSAFVHESESPSDLQQPNQILATRNDIENSHVKSFSAQPQDGIARNADVDPASLQSITKSNESMHKSTTKFNKVDSQQPFLSQASHTDLSIPGSKANAAVLLPTQSPASILKLRDRAKAALISLTSHDISYDDFLAEGVNEQLLKHLYEELGISWSAQGSKTEPTTSIPTASAEQALELVKVGHHDSASLRVSSPSNPSGQTPGRVSPAVTLVPRASPKMNPNLERKDRIAQLLAAKAGKPALAGVASKSQSPISATGFTQPQIPEAEPIMLSSDSQPAKSARGQAQIEVVRQKMEQLKRETLAKTKAEQLQGDNITADSHNIHLPTAIELSQIDDPGTLPTPVKEHLVQNGLSSLIPGLFMTSAELDDGNVSAQSVEDEIGDQTKPFVASNDIVDEQFRNSVPISSVRSVQSSRKRSIAEDSHEEESDYPDIKRQAMQPERSADVSMDGYDVEEDASEGEIIEDSSEVQLALGNLPAASVQTDTANTDYLNKQTEIEAMRKRIAEMEQRQNLKRGQSYVLNEIASNASTPTTALPAQILLNSPSSKIPEQPTLPLKGDDRTCQSPRTLIKATPEQIAERAAQLKADFLRQRALRQKQLQEGIPALNNEVVKTQAKLKDTRTRLDALRKDIEQHEMNIARAREDEIQLLQQIDRLEKQISDGVSGQKQYSTELQDLKHQTDKDTITQPNALSITTEPQAQVLLITENSSRRVSEDNGGSYKAIENGLELSNTQDHSLLEVDVSQTRAPSHFSTTGQASRHTKGPESVQDTPELNVKGYSLQKASGQDFEPQLSTIPSAQVVEQLEGQADESDEAMDESDEESDDSRMSIDDDDSNDSASMSDSGSEEYEPAEPDPSHKLDERMELVEYEPEADGRRPEHHRSVREGDDLYQPADGYDPVDNVSPADVSQQSPVSVHTQTSASTNAAQFAPHLEEVAMPTQTVSDVPLAAGAVGEAKPDDQEQGLQLSEAATLTKAQILHSDEETDGPRVLGATKPSSVRYVPYQSPLSSYKSYRFHPSFNEQIKDGYRSLTYSYKIDPKLPICLSELDGVVCTDLTCQDQHFGSMALTDEKILVQLSSASDIKDRQLRDQYLLGLKQVIARLRQEGVKEFSAVANALSQYRREWTATQAGS